jgi:hypothetical protein
MIPRSREARDATIDASFQLFNAILQRNREQAGIEYGKDL